MANRAVFLAVGLELAGSQRALAYYFCINHHPSLLFLVQFMFLNS